VSDEPRREGGAPEPPVERRDRAPEARARSDKPSPRLTDDDEPDEVSLVELQAELDVPGETGRQARIFGAWVLCLVLAVLLGSAVGVHLSLADAGSLRAEREFSRARGDKAKVALVVGLLLPSLLTLGLNRRYRRGGSHARGITVDVTAAGELRIWGRGYGSRVHIDGAEVTERLVDVYAGRLGAWRQRRLRVRGKPTARGGSLEIELATTARRSDMEEGLRVEGGEGDCVELSREGFDRLRACVLARAPLTPEATPSLPREPETSHVESDAKPLTPEAPPSPPVEEERG